MRRPLIATYEPKPIDTSGVVFDDEMAGLAERLAANAHEIWAQQRIRDGWTYGPTRDDEAKEHPCLVPYGELPDSEKEYDRVMGGPRLRVFSSRKDPTESLDYRSTFLGGRCAVLGSEGLSARGAALRGRAVVRHDDILAWRPPGHTGES